MNAQARDQLLQRIAAEHLFVETLKVVLRGLLDVPHITLIASAAPVVIGTVFPPVEDGFVLPLVVGAAKRERVLRPDDEGGPFTTSGAKRSLQGIEFT